MSFVGVDYSITSPGICVHPIDSIWMPEECVIHVLSSYSNDCYQLNEGITLDFEKMQSNSKTESHIRYEELKQWSLTHIPSDAEVYFEDYSYGAKGRVFHIAENCGITKHALYQRGHDISVVAPTVIKKYATGKGNASKEEVIYAFEEDTGIDLLPTLGMKRFESPATDIADSYFICKYLWSQYFSRKRIEENRKT